MLVSVLLHIATTVHLVINGNLSRLLLLMKLMIGGGKWGRKVVANGRLLLFHLLADETCVICSQRLGVIIALRLATAKARRLLALLLKTVVVLMSFQ